jgi:hypothetical protein
MFSLSTYKRGPDSGVVFVIYGCSFAIAVLLGYFGGNLVYGGPLAKARQSCMRWAKARKRACTSR